MGHTEVVHTVVTGLIWMTQLEMEDCWTLPIGEVIAPGIILVLVNTSMMIDIVIILTRGAIGGIFWMILRKQSHLCLMER